MNQAVATARLKAVPDPRGKGWHLWVLVAVMFGSLVLTAWNVRAARIRVSTVAQQDAAHQRVHDIAGRRLPTVELETLDGQRTTLDSITGAGPALIWFISSQDCLYCLAEVESWKRFAAQHRDMTVLIVASGPSLDPIREFRASENVEFPIFYDARGQVLQGLGASGATPARLFAKQRMTLIFSQGEEAGLPMLELIERVLSTM